MSYSVTNSAPPGCKEPSRTPHFDYLVLNYSVETPKKMIVSIKHTVHTQENHFSFLKTLSFSFEIASHVAQASLESTILLPQAPPIL